jgi:hypothetical protein
MRGRGLERMFLHAHSLSFEWPGGGGPFSASAPLPPDLGAVIDRLSEPGVLKPPRRSDPRGSAGQRGRSGPPRKSGPPRGSGQGKPGAPQRPGKP